MKTKFDVRLTPLAILLLSGSVALLFSACSDEDSIPGPLSENSGGSSSGGSQGDGGSSSGGSSKSSGGSSLGGAGGEGGDAGGGLGGAAGMAGNGNDGPAEPIPCSGVAEFPFVGELGIASYEGGLHFFVNPAGGEPASYSTPEGIDWSSSGSSGAPICADQRIFIARRTCEGDSCELAVEYSRFEWREGMNGELYLCQTASGLESSEAALSSDVPRADDTDLNGEGCLGTPWQALVLDEF